MPECVATEPGQQNNFFLTISLFQYLLIAVTHDTSKSLVQCSLMLYVAEAVHKHKIRISIYPYLTFLLLHKGFSHIIKHWHSSSSCFCLRSVYREIASVLAVIVIHQCMIHADCTILKVQIFPP